MAAACGDRHESGVKAIPPSDSDDASISHGLKPCGLLLSEATGGRAGGTTVRADPFPPYEWQNHWYSRFLRPLVNRRWANRLLKNADMVSVTMSQRDSLY